MRLSDEGHLAAPAAVEPAPAPPAGAGPQFPGGGLQPHQTREPGGAAAGRRRHSAPRERHVAYFVIICALAATVLWMWQSGQIARGGTLALAGIVLAAALARLTLPERRAGMLVTRSRVADVMILTALGAGILGAALVLPA